MNATDTLDVQRIDPHGWTHDDWLDAYEKRGTVAAACRAVGISRETAYQHRKRNPEFAEAWERHENAVTDLLEKTLVEIAIEDRNVRACEIALKARRPEKYREGLKIEHGGVVKHEVRTGMEAEIDKLADELERRGDSGAQGEAALPALAQGS